MNRDEVVSKHRPQPTKQQLLQIREVDGVVHVPQRVHIAIPDWDPRFTHPAEHTRTKTAALAVLASM
jgi:hypothetical protein